ncbi:hypothetical protein EYC80_003300 [Monilinia laxa]|uniref:Xylanolytic transcriptional activator regulatory domain-containing protein n=1 Tax=Monilinia laxa TaxID=61186 RepID=A0A5N6KD98_MONLA|nr:hypothetical protein EYC80_003300 [Monilinia laxa]
MLHLLLQISVQKEYMGNVWHAMSQEFREPDNHSDSSDDDVREADVKKAWDQIPENDNFLFGSRTTTVDISTLHPDPVQIFRLWQIYLENVNPLLKVTHTPSLQGLIIEAASNVSNIKPNLEALMFGIYSMSISSLSVEDCQLMFSSSKTDLLTRYHFGCQQGLLNSGFLRNRDDMHCLTALFFYLLSIRTNSVPQSLSSMLAVAIRIAQRMGCHSELALSKLSALEAEMRRRLWWSLVLYDTRIGELSDSKHAILAPTWDCKIPLNVGDSDFHMEMKEPPQIQGKPTEAIFAVLRCELADFIRNTTFHLDFNNPALKPAAKDIQHDPSGEGSELANLEKLIEDKYLKFCDPENPIHFMTIWTTRFSISKWHLVEHWHFSGKNYSSKVGLVRDATISHALTMLECDTKLMTSPLVKGFIWMSYMYFPFPAYFQIVQNLKRRPLSEQAEQAWETMTANYEARFPSLLYDERFQDLFFRSSQKSLCRRGRQKIAKLAENSNGGGGTDGAKDLAADAFSMVTPVGFYGVGDEYAYPEIGSGPGPGISGDMWGFGSIDSDVSLVDWSAIDWSAMFEPGDIQRLTNIPPHERYPKVDTPHNQNHTREHQPINKINNQPHSLQKAIPHRYQSRIPPTRIPDYPFRNLIRLVSSSISYATQPLTCRGSVPKRVRFCILSIPYKERVPPSQGRVLGGSTAINRSAYIANSKYSLDAWGLDRHVENTGWGVNGDPFSSEVLGGYINAMNIDPETRERSHALNAYYEPIQAQEDLIVVTGALGTKDPFLGFQR